MTRPFKKLIGVFFTLAIVCLTSIVTKAEKCTFTHFTCTVNNDVAGILPDAGFVANELVQSISENNTCETAIPLVCGETVDGSTTNAAPGGFNFCNGASNSSPALWYKYTAAAYSFFEVIVTSANFNAEVYVYGGDCGDLQCTGYPEGVAYAGQTYYIVVTGWDTETGDFAINLNCSNTNACSYPTLNTTMVDESGDEIIDCLPLGDIYGVEVSLTGGDEDSYTVFVGGSSKVMYPPETHLFGTFEAGLNTIVRVIVDSSAEFCDLYGLAESEICPLTNYDCATAQEIACGETLAGATLGATPVPDGLDWCTANPAPLAGAVWYKVTPDANALMTVGITTNDFDTQHLVFSGSCGELVCIGSSDFADFAFQANANETYYIVVTGLDNSEGLFDLSVTCDPIFCESPDLTATAVDDEGVEIEGCLDFGSTHRVEVSLANGSGNDSYTVSVGDSTLVMVVGDTHIFGSYNVGANVNVNVVGDNDADCNVNTSVWVAVCLPVNNSCETATVLNCWETIDGSTIDASIAPPGIDFCNGLASPSAPAVWYKYTGDSYGFPYVSITLDNYDSRYFVYKGTCGDLQCIGGSDDDSISWTSYAGQTFYIMVTGSGTAAGDFVLNLDCYNTDLCSYPTLNTTMVDENGDEIIDCLPVGDTYRVEVSLGVGGDFDSYTVFVGDSSKVMFPPETHVFGTFDAGSNTNVIVMGIEFPDEACALYGLIESELCPPANDLPCDATPLNCDSYVVGSNISATENVGCNGSSRQTVWYSFTAPANGYVFMTTCNPETNFDTDINMYTGTCDEDLVCFPGWGDEGYIDGNQECGFQAWASEGIFDMEAGVTYYIAVTGYNAAGGGIPWTGDFGLSLTCTFDESAILDGTVDWNADCGDRNLTVDFYDLGTEVLAGSYMGMVSADGTFSIPDVVVGTFDIILKVDGFLALGVEDVDIVVDGVVLDLGAIMAGDINGDNGINIIDVSVLNAAFGSIDGAPNYNPLADMNCDGGVNIVDISILNVGFGMIGDSPGAP